MTNQNSERVAKNTGFMFIRMLVVVGVGLFTSREVLRVLGVNDFGIYNLVGTIVVMFTFLQTALNNATSRFITYDLGAGNTANLQRTFSMSMNTELILAGIIMLLSEIVGVWFIGNKLHIPDGRMEGLKELFNVIRCSAHGLRPQFDCNLPITADNHPSNKNTWKPLAKALIETCRKFISD